MAVAFRLSGSLRHAFHALFGCVLLAIPINAATLTNPAVSITVDAALNRHPISPLIYGLASATSNQLAGLNAPLNRSGGNAETRYNWQLNAHNRAADFYFESIADASSAAGAAGDSFVGVSKSAGAEPLLTVPLIGWVAKLGPSRGKLASYSILKYGPQVTNDAAYFPDAGNGVSVTNQTPITWNSPTDANVLTDSTYQQSWVRHLTNLWRLSTNGGVRYYLMDNEPSIWHSTHRDVHPIGASMRELRDKFFDYAAQVKAVDPGALVLGPEEWGWSGYFYSGYDQQWSALHTNYNPALFPDRATNGGSDFLPWFLDQVRQRATNTHQRLLDYFTVHYYPQGGEFGNDTSTAMQLRRNKSTRSLWDTNYVDATWINAVVKLIPRLRGWAAQYYPGTKVGLTEYNWGAEGHINGATAQADLLGIFGREGLDLATRWTTPAVGSPVYKAIQLYRNYDGARSTFGETSVSATGPNPDSVAVFASLRSADGALTLMAINKEPSAFVPANIHLANFLPNGTAQAWQLTASNVIRRLSDLPFTGNTFSNLLPAQSITLFVLAPGNPARLRAAPGSSPKSVDVWVDAQAGQSWLLSSSSNLLAWRPFQTNTLQSNSWHLFLPATNTSRFFRAQLYP